MISFSKSINCPTTLSELPGFTEKHIERALTAAKNPQLDMKLKNMPVPLNSSLVDEYMKPILEAGKIFFFNKKYELKFPPHNESFLKKRAKR